MRAALLILVISANLSTAEVFSSVEEVRQEDWLAYPKYSTDNDYSGFQLSPGLFYINRIEWAASAMEMSVIGAKNVGNLVNLYLNKSSQTDTEDRPNKSEL